MRRRLRSHCLQRPRAGRIQLVLEAGDHAGFVSVEAAQFIDLPLQLLFGLGQVGDLGVKLTLLHRQGLGFRPQLFDLGLQGGRPIITSRKAKCEAETNDCTDGPHRVAFHGLFPLSSDHAPSIPSVGRDISVSLARCALAVVGRYFNRTYELATKKIGSGYSDLGLLR